MTTSNFQLIDNAAPSIGIINTINSILLFIDPTLDHYYIELTASWMWVTARLGIFL